VYDPPVTAGTGLGWASGIALLCLSAGCGSAWLTIESRHVYVADIDGPVVLYVPSEDTELEGLSCVDVRTKELRWTIPDAHPNLLAFSPRRTHFYFTTRGTDAGVRFFRTSDGSEVARLSKSDLGDPDLSHFDKHVAISLDGGFIAAAGTHDGMGGAMLRLVDTSTGRHQDLTFGEGWAVRDLRFGPPGWVAARSPGELVSLYTYSDSGIEKRHDVAARQAWWATDRLVFITPEGRFGTLTTDGARHDTPNITLGPERAQRLDDYPDRVIVAADGNHLWLDASDHVRLIRLSDGQELFRGDAYAHRGSNFRAIHGAYFTAHHAGIVYTANAEYEGRLSIVDLGGATTVRTDNLGKLGDYGGGLPGFDIGSVFRWRNIPDITPDGRFLVLVGRSRTSVEALSISWK